MKIRHERPLPDLAFQVRAPLGLELPGGERLSIDQWSLEGIHLPQPCDVAPKQGILCIPFQGVDIRFPVQLSPGADPHTMRFDGLTGRQRETLAVFYNSILSGKMAATDDIITSLDTPVDLVPMEETEDEATAGRQNHAPRPVRAMATIAAYAVIALAVFWTLGHGIFGTLAQVDIRNARAEAALTPYLALQDAYVDDILVQPGDTVDAGDILIRVSNPKTASALDGVRSRIDVTARRLAQAQSRQAELQRRIDRARANLEIAVAMAPPIENTNATTRLDAFDERILAEYRDLFDAFSAAKTLVNTLEEDLSRLKRSRGQLKDAANASHIVAQEAGIVTEVTVFDGQFVAKGAHAAVVETLDPRSVRGWVPPSRAQALHLGQSVTAQIVTADGPRSFDGRIQTLTAGIDAAYAPEFGTLVTVALDTLSAAESRQILTHQMPVTLTATRPWVTKLLGAGS